MEPQNYFFTASPEQGQALNRLIEKSGARDIQDLFQKSLMAIDSLVTSSLQGKKIQICDADESYKKEFDLLKFMGAR